MFVFVHSVGVRDSESVDLVVPNQPMQMRACVPLYLMWARYCLSACEVSLSKKKRKSGGVRLQPNVILSFLSPGAGTLRGMSKTPMSRYAIKSGTKRKRVSLKKKKEREKNPLWANKYTLY